MHLKGFAHSASPASVAVALFCLSPRRLPTHTATDPPLLTGSTAVTFVLPLAGRTLAGRPTDALVPENALSADGPHLLGLPRTGRFGAAGVTVDELGTLFVLSIKRIVPTSRTPTSPQETTPLGWAKSTS